jgi:hypothetical protein
MQRGQNSHLRDQGVSAFKAQATSLKDADERDVAKNQVAYAVNMELRSEGRSPLTVKVDDAHPKVRAVLTALSHNIVPRAS